MLVVALGTAAWPGRAAKLEAAARVIDITPPVGWRMSGYFYERLNTGTHDPLQAKVLVLRHKKERAALVFCDLIGIPLEVSSRVRQEASFRTGIPITHILVAGTHSHTGPLYYGALRDHFHRAAVAKEGRDPKEWINYTEILVDRIVSALDRANRSLEPVQVEVARPLNVKLSFNRRFHMRDGSVVFNPGKMNTNILRAVGPIDPEVDSLIFLTPDRRQALASFTSFALHLDTVGGTQYSADYPLYLEQELKKVFGPQLISIFGTGTCGDINHIDVSNKLPQKGQAEAKRIGTALARTLVDAFPEFKLVKKPTLEVRSATVPVPLQRFTPEQVADARKTMDQIGTGKVPFLKLVEAYKILDTVARGASEISLEVQVFKIGRDTAIVGLPGEVFVDLGLAIKEGSPFRNTFVVELCNDSIGYVPTKKAFKEGSYEVVNSRVQPGGGESLVETALRLLRDLD
jgi:hypothetical protein